MSNPEWVRKENSYGIKFPTLRKSITNHPPMSRCFFRFRKPRGTLEIRRSAVPGYERKSLMECSVHYDPGVFTPVWRHGISEEHGLRMRTSCTRGSTTW